MTAGCVFKGAHSKMDVLLFSLSLVNIVSFLVSILYILKRFIPRWMHFTFEWGKSESAGNCSGLIQILHVPNRWFTHFYVVGSSLSFLFLLMLVLHCFHGVTSVPKAMSHILSLHFTPHIDCFTAFVSLFLLLVQTCRRLYECCFISVFSSRIHILHYFVGIAFYILDAAAVAVPFLKAEQIDKDWCNSCRRPFKDFSWYQWLAVAMFLWASLHQWRCHNILAKLRHSPSMEARKVYRIPYGDWFEFVSSPHYLAEIMIYISLFLLQKAKNIYIGLILLLTVENLSLGATVTHDWYKKKFKEYPQSRYRIVPLLY